MQRQNEEPHINALRELMKLSHLLGKYLNTNLGIFGLNRTQRRIITFILSNNDSMTPTELSRESLLTIDTINKSIDKLDKIGLTRSYRSKRDRRVRKVTLTEKGLEMIEKSLPLRYMVLSQVMGCFNEEEIKVFLDSIKRLIEQVSNLTEKNAVPTAPDIP